MIQKKSLGQHFLRDENIARKIIHEFCGHVPGSMSVVEVGPGRGVLTKYLAEQVKELYLVEIDADCVSYLLGRFPLLKERVIHQDILKTDFTRYVQPPFAVIGNFPYNISSQILFKILEYRNQVPWVVGMFQKEVAQRIGADAGGKEYGILSVLIQAYYEVEYLFEVGEKCFSPPPKVKSAVIRLKRNSKEKLGCDEELFVKIVKAAFNKRRKTLRNALKELMAREYLLQDKIFEKRAEQLSVEQFIELTLYASRYRL